MNITLRQFTERLIARQSTPAPGDTDAIDLSEIAKAIAKLQQESAKRRTGDDR